MKTDQKRVKTALVISFFISFLSLTVKGAAFLLTDSIAAMSDAIESVVHVIAVGFVLYGFTLSQKPADDDHLYGHERVEFLSVGVEGVVIILAGITIMSMAIQNLIFGFELQNLADGVILVAAAGIINLVLGLYVKKVGREENSVIAISNGKHVLTDVYTSLGVLVTLGLIYLSGWTYLDIIISFAIGIYIIKEGFVLINYSVKGIMDTRNPEVHNAVHNVLMDDLPKGVKGWHQLRHRSSGQTTWIELHLIFDSEITLQDAHDLATATERKLIDALKGDAVVTIHLEPEEPHDVIHRVLKGANKNRPLDDYI